MFFYLISPPPLLSTLFFFSTDTATTEIYTLSLHDALPISERAIYREFFPRGLTALDNLDEDTLGDRKSTRLNSSHVEMSYAVFCLNKKTLGTPRKVAAGPYIVASHLAIGRPPACWDACRGRAYRGVCVRFFFKDTATTEIDTLSLHDALPI